MIKIKKELIIEKLGLVHFKNRGGMNDLVNNILHGDGIKALAFLVKRGDIVLSKAELNEELDYLVENSLVTIGSHEGMVAILNHHADGQKIISNFVKKQGRIKIL